MKKTNDEYKCPYCGNDGFFESYEYTVEGDRLIHTVICEVCEKMLEHIYELEYVKTIAAE